MLKISNVKIIPHKFFKRKSQRVPFEDCWLVSDFTPTFRLFG